MVTQFERDGVRFRYPELWKLDREESEGGWTVYLQSPETAFLLICLRTDLPSVEELSESAVDALRQEYQDVDVEETEGTLAGQPTVGHEIRFFSFDLTNTCWTHSLYCEAGTLLLMCQTSDLELATNGAILRAICASLEVDD